MKNQYSSTKDKVVVNTCLQKNYISLMDVTFNVLQKENQPLKSPQTFPKSALGQGE
jgi:hypothetical protein